MSERKSVSKPEKKAKSEDKGLSTASSINSEEALIDIPAVKKKKERRVKTEAEIAAKAERKRLRKEAEAAKLAQKQAGKSASSSSTTTSATKSGAPANAGTSAKVPKWKQFLKNTADADNAEKLKNVEFDVEGSDDEDDDDNGNRKDQQQEKESKEDKKRAMEQGSGHDGSNKRAKAEGVAAGNSENVPLDMSTPGLQYLVEWKRFRSVWKFQKMRQVWLLKHMYSDKDLPDTHWPIFLEYIKDLKGAARTATIEEAQKIVDAPEEESEYGSDKEDTEMKEEEDKDEKGDGEEGKENDEEEEEDAAKKEKREQKRQREIKSARALELLQLLA